MGHSRGTCFQEHFFIVKLKLFSSFLHTIFVHEHARVLLFPIFLFWFCKQIDTFGSILDAVYLFVCQSHIASTCFTADKCVKCKTLVEIYLKRLFSYRFVHRFALKLQPVSAKNLSSLITGNSETKILGLNFIVIIFQSTKKMTVFTSWQPIKVQFQQRQHMCFVKHSCLIHCNHNILYACQNFVISYFRQNLMLVIFLALGNTK